MKVFPHAFIQVFVFTYFADVTNRGTLAMSRMVTTAQPIEAKRKDVPFASREKMNGDLPASIA
jgi:hypothetical protein